MKFSKAKMLERVEREGLGHLVDDEVKAHMDNLDGQPASASCWRRQVFDEPVMWVVGKDGVGSYVNEADCI